MLNETGLMRIILSKHKHRLAVPRAGCPGRRVSTGPAKGHWRTLAWASIIRLVPLSLPGRESRASGLSARQ